MRGARAATGNDLETWLLDVTGGDEHTLVRVAMIAAREALPPEAPERGALALLLGAYLTCPCREHALAAHDAARTAEQVVRANTPMVATVPDDPALLSARSAAAVQAALRTPGRSLATYGAGAFVRTLEASASLLAARRGALRAAPEDLRALRDMIERAL